MLFPTIFAVFAVCNAQLLDLKSYPGNSDTTIAADVKGSYSIYVSASSDDDALLKQVFVKTSDNNMKSLYDLKNNRLFQNSGMLQPYLVDHNAMLSSKLSNDQMSTLKGYLYLTTPNQAKNTAGFLVYNVAMSEKIQTTDLVSDATYVFLNTNFGTDPWQSSTISAWIQSQDSSVYIYEGVPTDKEEKLNSHIFSNPVNLASGINKQQFMTSVEVFSLSLGAFYFKVHNKVQFVIEPSFVDLDQSRTSGKVTTGLYMKPFNSADRKVTVFTGHENDGTTGFNVVGNVPANANLAITSVKNWATTPTSQIQGWSVGAIGDSFSLETTGSVAGEVFVQYYVIQNSDDTTTTKTTILPGRQTTARIQTTTGSAGAVQLISSLLIPILGARLL